jgi:23S rRNA (uracil1939-C5)-methyltransferase
MPDLDLDLDRVATGGAGLGRGPDGRIAFVAGGLPGERVRARVVAEHRSRIEAELIEVLAPASGRCLPPCNHVADGCGGCDWQHADEETQRRLRREIVVDCLRRLAGMEEPPVELGPGLPAVGYRTTVRAAVTGGRAGFRQARSHSVVIVEGCVVAHPLVEEILVDGHFGSAREVTVRVGARTGERLVLVSPTAEAVSVPGDVVVVGQDEIEAGRQAFIHELIAGRTLRISAPAFFQCRPDGAEVLVDLVGAALSGAEGPVLDAYCGVGLFGACLPGGRPVVGVESNRWSAADATVNYRWALGAGRPGFERVVRSRVERWRPQLMGAVVADPSRSGLGRRAAQRLAETGAPVIALVSCDPASLARDATLLAGHGYRLERVTTVDLFAQTSHIETVSRFVRP